VRLRYLHPESLLEVFKAALPDENSASLDSKSLFSLQSLDLESVNLRVRNK